MAKKKIRHRYWPHGFVYFAVCDELHVVKIGMSNRWLPASKSSTDPVFAGQGRIGEIQTYCPAAVRLAGMVPADVIGAESAFHHAFRAYRKHGEWFWYIDELKRLVDALSVYEADCDRMHASGNYDGPGPIGLPINPFHNFDFISPLSAPNLPAGWGVVRAAK